MSVAFDPSGDFSAVCDALEPVTVIARDGETAATPAALRRAAEWRELAGSGGSLLAGDVFWHLPVSDVPERPSPGATITDAAEVNWLVLSVAAHVTTGRWRCVARNLAAIFGLDELLSIEEAEFGQDGHGAPTVRWRTFRPAVRASLRPIAWSASIEHDLRLAEATHVALFAEELPLTDLHRIVAADGRTYRVRRVEYPARLGEPMRAEVSNAPWPL